MNDYSIELSNEQVVVLYTNNEWGWVGSLMLALGILFAYDFPNISASYIFSSIVVILSFAHILNSHQYGKTEIRRERAAEYWVKTASIISAMQGLSIGLTPWLMLDLNDPSKVYLVTALLVLPMYGSAAVSGTSKVVHIVWCLTSTLPLVAFLIVSGYREYEIMAVMILLTGIPSSIIMNVYFYNLFTKTIELKYENLGLLNNVQNQKKIADKESHEKSRFIAATSHDLRQPLHALILYLDALDIKLENTEHRDLLIKAQNSSQALSDLLNSLMDVSQLDAGIVTPRNSLQNIEELIGLLITELKSLTLAKNITLSSELEIAFIQTDPVLLSRIIRNLVINAIDHNDSCDIVVSSRIQSHKVIIKITDTGKGIPKQELENIFSEFHQLDNPERDRNKGIGLGLAIVKRLSNLLKIQLTVDSQLGKGSCFSLTLPINNPLKPLSDEPVFLNEYDLTGQFIMCVEDDEIIADALKVLLRNWNCEVLMQRSEEQLLNEIELHQYPAPDVLISDYRLQNNKNGGDVIKTIRQYYNQKIPSVIITGDTSNEIKDHLNELSCELLFKPLQSKNLRKILESIKKKHH